MEQAECKTFTTQMQSYEIIFNKNNTFSRKMNKDVLVALIAKDVNELQVLTEGLDQMEVIPAPFLRLALDKSKALTTNIDNLINYLNNKELEAQTEAHRLAEFEAKKAEEAAREAELARIAEEQEALFRAEELERERQAEARRKAEEEMARQVAAIEAARQADLEERRRREEEAARQEELKRQEEEARRIAAEQEAIRQREEEARRIEAEEEARRVEVERIAREQAEEQARIQAELEARIEAERIAEEQAEKEKTERVAQEKLAAQVVVDAVLAESAVTTLADSIETTESLADKLAKGADDTLASSINNKKIIDLKAAITLGDRFRFQRELFGGNGEKMNKAISDFNSFETMDEAQAYIAKNFEWPLDNDAVSDFIQLLQRRYL